MCLAEKVVISLDEHRALGLTRCYLFLNREGRLRGLTGLWGAEPRFHVHNRLGQQPNVRDEHLGISLVNLCDLSPRRPTSKVGTNKVHANACQTMIVR